ncbi:MAG TPA: hypothetical protein VF989_09910 [Polyangiaceae bacterium]
MTLREAVRRLLWLPPALFALSLVTFVLASRLTGAREHAPVSHRTLPMFFNFAPASVESVAAAALDDLLADSARAEQGDSALTLVRIGGAGLPYVLPRLDGLSPKQRGRVAVALLPIAKRMGVAGVEAPAQPEAAVVFWTRFWQDRNLDFRAAVARRLVNRLARRHLDLRRDDLMELDTFALPALMAALERVEDRNDLERAARITPLLSHITSHDWTVEPTDSFESANRLVLAWHRWWARHRHEFSSLDGAERVAAMVRQTRYGEWATQAVRHRLGMLRDGTPVLEVLKARSLTTGVLIVAGLFGGLLGVLLGARLGHARRAASWLALGLVLAATPVAAWLALSLAPSGVRLAAGALAMLVAGAAKHASVELGRVRAWLGAHPARARSWPARSRTARLLRETGAAAISGWGAALPAVALMALAAELVLDLRGLGRTTLVALQDGDVSWLMALTLLSAFGAGLCALVGDAVLSLVSEPCRRALQHRAAG